MRDMELDSGASVPRRRSALVNTLAVYGTNVAGSALGLLNVLLVSRMLGPEGRGSVAFVVTMAMLVGQLSNLGIQSAVVNFGGANQRLFPSLAANSLVLSAALGAVSIGVVTLLIHFF